MKFISFVEAETLKKSSFGFALGQSRSWRGHEDRRGREVRCMALDNGALWFVTRLKGIGAKHQREWEGILCYMTGGIALQPNRSAIPVNCGTL